MPSTPFSGVRISWLIVARNFDFARLASVAWLTCFHQIVDVRHRANHAHGSPSSLRTASPRKRNQRDVPPTTFRRIDMSNV